MRVLKFEIENYKALAGKHEILPEGSSFFLVGGNGKGKTSAGRVLIDMLTKNYPTKPVTEGEHEGFAEITFDDQSQMLVKFQDGKKPKLSFITSEGMKVATPKDFFEKMAGPGMSFDIDKFLSLAPKPRRAMLEEMVGVDLSSLNWQEQSLMEEAKDLRRDHKVQQARIKPYDKSKVGTDPVDVKELASKINKAREVNVSKKNLEQIKASREERIAENLEVIKKIQDEIKKQENEIAEIDKKIDGLVIPDQFDMDIWESDMETADDTNRIIRLANEMDEEVKREKDLSKSLEGKEQSILDTRKLKEEEIKSKPLPANGLEFDVDGDGLILNGLPFEDAQIATSAKMIAALQIAESQLGKIRYLHFDAAILDKDNALKVLNWAESKGLQLCLERPIWDGGELMMEILDKTGEKVKEVKV